MAYNFNKLKEDFSSTEEWLGREYLSIHTGRATPAVLDSISVESYGARQSISHVASISVEDPRTLRVSPWDKELVKPIEKAIQASNLGLSVSTDEQGLRVFFPELTSERREVLSKLLKDKLEDARVTIRQSREEVWQDIVEKERAGEITEDDKFRLKDEMQKLVDEINKKLESLAERKEKEIKG